MILPDKNIKLEYSLLNCGAIILAEILEPQTISLLWDKVKRYEALVNYEKFLLTLDYLCESRVEKGSGTAQKSRKRKYVGNKLNTALLCCL